MFLKSPRPAAFIILFFLLALLPVNAVFAELSWATHLNLLIFAADNGPNADPAAVLPSLGVSVAWSFTDIFSLEFAEDIYFTNYEYNSEFGYPMACNPENRSAFVIGFITGIQAAASFPIGAKGISLRVFGGPSFDLRIVSLASGLHPSDTTGGIEKNAQLQTDAITDYFWSEGRMFLPVLGLGMDFPINENFLLGFILRTWFPLYRAWTDEDIPAIDGWRFGVSVRITPRKKS